MPAMIAGLSGKRTHDDCTIATLFSSGSVVHFLVTSLIARRLSNEAKEASL